MEITRKTIEDKLRELKQRLDLIEHTEATYELSILGQIDVRCIRSQIWLLEEILREEREG